MRVSVSARRAEQILALLVTCVVGLVLVSFVTQARQYLSIDVLSAVDQGSAGVPWLSVDAEQSIPAWFSSSVLLGCSVLLASLARDRPGGSSRGQWIGLAVVFLALSVDEAVGFHEKAIVPVRSALGTDGFLYFAWVIPGAVLVAIVALLYLTFVIALPRRPRRLVVVAALLFVGGALVTELFGAAQVAEYGQSNLAYVTLSTTEELLEMLGATVFLYALMLLTDPNPVEQSADDLSARSGSGNPSRPGR